MKTRFLLALAAATGLLVSSASAEMRTWTQASNGTTVEAEFVKFENGKITIKFASGKTREIAANLFIKEDQDYAKEFQMELDAEASGTSKVSNAFEEVVLWDVHICCNSCVDRIQKTALKIKGAVTKVDKTGQNVVVRSNSKDTLQKVLDAIGTAGFYGDADSNFNDLKIRSPKGGDSLVESATFSGVHLCCDDCVDAVRKALGDVAGVTDFKVTKGESSFVVKGSFKPAEVVEALHAAGLHATFK